MSRELPTGRPSPPIFFIPSVRKLALPKFSATELKHVATGTALATAAGFSLSIGTFRDVQILIGAASFFALGFILHEMAHKLVAQDKGLWAEFRLNSFGALLTLLSVLSPIKIIAPGAVMIFGPATRRTVGLTSIAGPLTNVLISLVLVTLAFFSRNFSLRVAAIDGAYINAFMAFFNLIPFGVLDGQKIFWWDKRVWVGAFVVSILLIIFMQFNRPF